MGIKINFATGFEIPPYFLRNTEIVKKLEENSVFASYEYISAGILDDNLKEELLGVPHFDELMMRHGDEGEWWKLPLDPVISVTGKNTIVRRSVLKTNEHTVRRGTVKEIWSQDDYEVNIAGVFIGESNKLPQNELFRLRKYCETRKIIQIRSRLLRIFGITRLAIEDFSLPFTKGMENQMYTIKAYSDDLFELLVEDSL
jgi:hypothetical protein